MNESELMELLGRNADFSRVTEEVLRELVAAGEVRDLEAGNELIREREAGQNIWVLVGGEMEVLVGGEIVNRIDTPGEVVGQISAVSLTPATATVRMSKAGRCLSIPYRALHEVMKGSPQLAEGVLRSMAKYLGGR